MFEHQYTGGFAREAVKSFGVGTFLEKGFMLQPYSLITLWFLTANEM